MKKLARTLGGSCEIHLVEPEMLEIPLVHEELERALRFVLGDKPVYDDLIGEQAVDL